LITSAEEFVTLRSSSELLEYTRAANEDASEGVWLEVIERFPDFREWVAHNKTVPLSILERLSNDNEVSVRCAVADKSKLTYDLRFKLAQDPDSSVRCRVANNSKCEIELLEMLTTDVEVFVQEAARSRLKRINNVL
jgi:hypothetical protein